MKELIKEFVYEEDAIGVVEVILIIVVLIGLVVIFRDRIQEFINDIFDAIESKGNEIIK